MLLPKPMEATSRTKTAVSSKPRHPQRGIIERYVRAGKHRLSPDRAKSIRAISRETGVSVSTVRRWLQVDHYDEWFRWWPSEEALVRDLLPRQGKPSGAPLELLAPETAVWEHDE